MERASCQTSNGTPVTAFVKLGRLARILQDIFYQFRKTTYDASIKKIEYIDGIMHTYDTTGTDFAPTPQLLGMCASKRDEKTLLARYGCTQAAALMSNMLMYGLGLDKSPQTEAKSEGEPTFADINCQVVVAVVKMKEPHRKFVRVAEKGERDLDDPVHEFFKVTLLVNGVKDSYALDLSSAQYGYYNPLVGYHDYVRERVLELKCEESLNEVKDTYSTFQDVPGRPEQKRVWAEGILFELWQWERQEGVRLGDIIGLPEGDFEEKKLKLLKCVEKFLASSKIQVVS